MYSITAIHDNGSPITTQISGSFQDALRVLSRWEDENLENRRYAHPLVCATIVDVDKGIGVLYQRQVGVGRHDAGALRLVEVEQFSVAR